MAALAEVRTISAGAWPRASVAKPPLVKSSLTRQVDRRTVLRGAGDPQARGRSKLL